MLANPPYGCAQNIHLYAQKIHLYGEYTRYVRTQLSPLDWLYGLEKPFYARAEQYQCSPLLFSCKVSSSKMLH